MHKPNRAWFMRAAAAALAALSLTACTHMQTATGVAPTVAHIEGRPTLQLATYDLGQLGYAVEEYFISGTAQSYRFTQTPGMDGPWNVTPDATAPYVTRIVVVRPTNPARFSGTVITEWFNVTGGGDLSAEWNMAHREMMRHGDVYVGVSAQRTGIEGGGGILGGANLPGLKQVDPQRYGALSHPGDAFSYDIFSQVGQILRNRRSGVLDGFEPRRLLAAGESQSAAFLVTYVNAIDPIARVYDGYLIHSRFGPAAALSGALIRGEGMPPLVKYRSDLRAPVLTIITETDLFGLQPGPRGYLAVRQSDSARLRTWEIAGAAHADRYAVVIAPADSGLLPTDQLAAAFQATNAPAALGPTARMNDGPQHHYIVQAALRALDRWVATGRAPPTSARLEVLDSHLALDSNGLAQGGIRTPWVDAPTSRLSGLSSAQGFLAFMGSSEHFDSATLNQLYPGGRTDYMARFTCALDSSIAQGFILPADRQEILDLAAATYPP